MIDNEIIKALECCTRSGCSDNETKDCPLKPFEDCSTRLASNALDLIKRQQAEIERLKKENNDLTKNCVRCKDEYARTILDDLEKSVMPVTKVIFRGKVIHESPMSIIDFRQKYIKENKDEITRKILNEMIEARDSLVKEMTEDKQ